MPAEHVEEFKSVSIIIDPPHPKRTESEEFRKSKERLKADGHYGCYVCGATENLQVHHYGMEWSEQGYEDYTKLKEWLLEWDIYGYSKLLQKQPIMTADDVRNMMVICQSHHTGVNKVAGNATGIHYLPFPIWIAQKIALKGKDPVPQKGETIQETEKRLS